MALSDIKIRNAKPREKPYKLFDEHGLYLLVSATGAKRWRLKYRFKGTEKTLALGRYPEVPLVTMPEKNGTPETTGARELCIAARRLLLSDKDPSAEKKAKTKRSRPKTPLRRSRESGTKGTVRNGRHDTRIMSFGRLSKMYFPIWEIVRLQRSSLRNCWQSFARSRHAARTK